MQKVWQWIKVPLITLVVLAGIVAVLFNNKAQSDAKVKSGEVLKSIPVSAATATKKKVDGNLTVIGTITANNDVAIVSETQGKVLRVLANVGDYKAAGSAIVEVDAELKRASYLSAEVAYEKAKKDLERNDALIKDGGISPSQLEGVRLQFKSAEAQFISARRQYRDSRITTPISGVVSSRPVERGTMVMPGMTIANVVDVAKLKVKVNAAEKDVFRMKVGDKVEVLTDVYPGVKFEGKVATISSKGDEAHTYPVEISLNNSKENPLKAGMFGSISFTSLEATEALWIPRAALVGSLKQAQVYVVESGVAKLRDVVVGDEAGTEIEVRQGLKEGEEIVTNGQNNLRDNIEVTVIKGAEPKAENAEKK